MASITLCPNADGTKGSGWTNESAGTTNLYQSVDESVASDTDYFGCNVASSTICLRFPTMPGNFSVATAYSLKVRCANSSAKGDFRYLSTCRLFKADETTGMNSGGLHSLSTTTSPTTFTLSDSLAVTDLTSWNGVRLKFFMGSTGTTGSGRVYWVELTITYDVAASGRVSRAGSLNGLGGVGQQNFNPLQRNRVWRPSQKAIYVPAFSLAK